LDLKFSPENALQWGRYRVNYPYHHRSPWKLYSE